MFVRVRVCMWASVSLKTFKKSILGLQQTFSGVKVWISVIKHDDFRLEASGTMA